MKHLFSPRMRVSTWRQLWVWLMESQKELGLPITDEALNQMKVNQIVKDEEFAIAAKEEARRRYAIPPFSIFHFRLCSQLSWVFPAFPPFFLLLLPSSPFDFCTCIFPLVSKKERKT